jgi:hypothetical protein
VEVKVIADLYPGTVLIQLPGAFIRGISTLRALVCSHCGLTRFYAEKPAEFLPKQ